MPVTFLSRPILLVFSVLVRNLPGFTNQYYPTVNNFSATII